MAHCVRPGVEPLEGRALMSGLVASLTTDRTTYQVGQPIHMTLTETNITDHELTIGLGPSIDGFAAGHNREIVWRSNSGIQPLFIALMTVPAHRSIVLAATWDGKQTEGAPTRPTGTFVIGNQIPGSPTATIQIVAPPPRPQSSPLVVKVTTDRSVYAPGQPVTITLTETNTSAHDVPVLTGCQILGAWAWQGGKFVWQYRDLRECPTGLGVLHAGQSRQFTLVWNGQPNLPGTRVQPGPAAVFAAVDGVLGGAIITIRPS